MILDARFDFEEERDGLYIKLEALLFIGSTEYF